MNKILKGISYSLVYIGVSVATAYGTITLSMNNSTSNNQPGNTGSSGNAGAVIPAQISSIIDNFTNSKALDLQLSADVASGDETYVINLDAELDLSQGLENAKVKGKLNAVKDNQAYDIDFSYQDNIVYLDMFNGKLSLETNNFFDSITQILEILDIEVSDMGGFDFASMDLNSMLGLLSNLTESKDEETGIITLTVDVPVVGQIDLICNSDYKLSGISTAINIDDIPDITISSTIEYPEEVIVEAKDEKEYIPTENLLTVAEDLLEYFKNDQIGLKFSLKHGETSFKGNINVDVENKVAAIEITKGLPQDARFILTTEKIYIECANVYLSFDFDELNDVNQLLNDKFNINLPVDAIRALLNAISTGDFSTLPTDLGFNFNLDADSIDLSMIESVTTKGNLTSVAVKEIGDIGIFQDEQGAFSRVAFVGQEVEAVFDVNTYNNTKLAVAEENYIDVGTFIPTVDNVIEIADQNTFTGNLIVSKDDTTIPVNYTFNKPTQYAHITTSFKGIDVDVKHIDGYVYLTIADKIKFVAQTDSAIEEIKETMNLLSIEITEEDLAPILEAALSALDKEAIPYLVKGLVQTETGFNVTLYNDITLSVGNDVNTLNLSTNIEGYNLSASIVGSMDEVEVPTLNNEDYNKVESIFDLAQGFIKAGLVDIAKLGYNNVSSGLIAGKVEFTYDDTTLNGTVAVDANNIQAKLNITINEKDLVVVYKDETFFLEYSNIYSKFSMENIGGVETLLKNRFGINLQITETLTKLKDTAEGKVNVVEEFLALNFVLDLSSIDSTMFDGATTEGNITTLPLTDIGTITFTKGEDKLENVSFANDSMRGSFTFGEFTNTNLTVNEENYINLATFIPTIDNVAGIIENNTFNGTITVAKDEQELTLNVIFDRTTNYAHVYTTIEGITVDIKHIDGYVYLNVADKIKFVAQTDSAIEEIKETMNLLSIEITEEDLTPIIETALSVLDKEAIPYLVKGLVQTETGFDITLYNDITLSVGNDVNTLNLATNVEGYNLSASIVGSMDEVEVPMLNNENYNKVESIFDLAQGFIKAGLVDIAKLGYNNVSSGLIAGKVEFTYDDTTLNGTVAVDANNIQAKLNITINEKDIAVVYKDQTFFLEYSNIYAKFSLENIGDVEKLLKDRFGITIPITETLTKLKDTAEGKVNIIEEFLALDFVLDLSNVDSTMFDSATTEGNITTLPLTDIGTITFTKGEDKLENVSFANDSMRGSFTFGEFTNTNLTVKEENYINLASFIPTVDNVAGIIENNTFNGTITVAKDEQELTLNVIFDRTTNYAHVYTTIEEITVDIKHIDGYVYLNVADKIKFVAQTDSAIEEIKETMNLLSIEITEEDLTPILETTLSVLDKEAIPYLVKGLVQTETGFDITLYNDITLSVGNDVNSLSLATNVEGYSISASIVGSMDEVEAPTLNNENYNKVESIFDLAQGFIKAGLVNIAKLGYNNVSSGLIAGNIEFTYDDTTLNGTLAVDANNAIAKLAVTFGNNDIILVYKNKQVFIEYSNIYAKFAFENIGEVEALLRDKFGIDIPITDIMTKLKNISEGKVNLVEEFLALDFVLDLSSIDSTMFDSATTEGNVTTLPLTDIGTITFTKAEDKLEKVAFVNDSINGSFTFGEFNEIKLSVADDNYVDLSHLIPTVENVIDLIENQTFTGEITINTGDMVIPVAYEVNRSNGIYAHASTTVANASIDIVYLNNKIYITAVNNVKLVIDVDNLPTVLKEILDSIGVNLPTTTIAEVLQAFVNIMVPQEDTDVKGEMNKLVTIALDQFSTDKSAPMISGLTQTETGFIISLGDINVVLDNATNEIRINSTIDSMVIDGYVIGSNNEVTIPTINESEYVTAENFSELIKAFFNMTHKKDFNIQGTLDIIGTIAGIDITWNVPFAAQIKDVDGEIQAMIQLGAIPAVVGVNNDVPYVFGDSDSGTNRMLYLYIKGEEVYIYRTEKVGMYLGASSRTYEKCTRTTIDALLEDPMRYVQYCIGFSDTIMDAIADSISLSMNRTQPMDINNIVNLFAMSDDTTFEVEANAAELANNPDLDTLYLTLGLGEKDNEKYIERLGFEVFMPLASIFELTLSTSDTKIVDYGSTVDMTKLYNYINNYQFAFETEYERTSAQNNNAWQLASEVKRSIIFEENGGNEVADLSLSYKQAIPTLPVLNTRIEDDGVTKVTKTFAGWYTTSTFDEGTLFTATTMPRKDIVLYAKWTDSVEYYRTLKFVPNCPLYTIADVTTLPGTVLDLPTTTEPYIIDDGITKNSKMFEGWYTDPAFENKFDGIMPDYDLTIYAKWVDNIEYYRTIIFVTNDSSSTQESIKTLAGSDITLPALVSKVEEVDGLQYVYNFDAWYTDSEFTTKFNSSFMPEEDTILYANWVLASSPKTLTVYHNDYTTPIYQTKISEGFSFSLNNIAGLPADTLYYTDKEFNNQYTSFVMEDDLVLYARRKYTITVTNSYGETVTYTDYQGQDVSIAQPATPPVYDDGDVRITYSFGGFSETITSIPNQDKTISIIWNEDKKHYYTVSFNTTWVKPSTWNDANSNFLGKITCKSAATSISSIKLLEGTLFNSDNYVSNATYAYKAVGISATYDFKTLGWNTTGSISVTDGASNYSYDSIGTFEITGNVTLYGIWGKA